MFHSKRAVVEIGMLGLLLLALSSMAWNWYHPKINNVPYDRYIQVPVEKKVETIRRVTVPGPVRIVTIEKKELAKELDMPWLMDDSHPAPIPGKAEDLQPVANANVPPSAGGMSAVAVTNTETGDTAIVFKEKPLPLFGFPSDAEVMARYGLSAKDGNVGNVAGRWQFLRVGKIRIGAYGEIDSRTDGKVMLEVAYKF